MNVLLFGAWDMAGACLADRLILEGNRVCWVTEEEHRLLWNRRLKGAVYRGRRSREEYYRILKTHSIDTVIFMTGPLRENYDRLPDYRSLVGDLTDLLNILRGYPLKSFVYFSSLELDYPDLYTPVMTDLAAGEMLCQAYQKTYGLPALILRFGCVYGSFAPDRMGYTGYLLEQLAGDPVFASSYSAGDYIDTIYGEDIASAVYLLLTLNKQGLYRLFGGAPLTFQEFFSCLGHVLNVTPRVHWSEAKRSPGKDFFLSDRSVNLETGWLPLTLLSEKGVPLLQKALLEQKQEHPFSPVKQFFRSAGKMLQAKRVRGLAETLLAFGATCMLLQFSKDISDLKYVDIRLLFVTFIAALHSLKLGCLAIVLATGSYLYSLAAAQVDISYFLYSVDTWIPFMVYAIAGTSIGYITDMRKDEMEHMQEKYSLLSEKYEFLKSVHEETLDIKGKLQNQIRISRYGFGYAYEVAVRLDSLKPELIILKVISILEHIMDCKKAAIYLINDADAAYARLKACSSELRDTAASSLEMDRFPRIRESFRKKKVYVNTALEAGYPDYAAPLYYQNRLFAFVAIYDIGAEKFTVYFQNLFLIITNLIEQNLAKALEYEQTQKDVLYYPGTSLLHPQAFEERVSIMRSESGDIAYSFILGKVYPLFSGTQEEVAGRIASVIRGSDCMGVDGSGDYAVILVNMKKMYLDALKERFRRAGLRLEVETDT